MLQYRWLAKSTGAQLAVYTSVAGVAAAAVSPILALSWLAIVRLAGTY
jgi:hypothetical protein